MKLTSANLKDVNLQKAKLRGVNLSGLNLSGVNLDEADLSAADLTGTNLKKACLKKTNLQKASLKQADLMVANLEQANFYKTDLTDAKTYGWIIKNADFTDAIMPNGEIYQSETTDGELNQPETSEKSSQKVTSMTRKIIRTDKAPAPVGPYNQAIAATGTTIFVAGQIAIDTRINDIVYTDDVAKQTEQVMANLGAILTEAGANWSNVVKTTVFLKDMNDFAAVNAVYAKYFDEATAPARACVEVSRLPKDVLVEIDCIAVI
ncbi:MAG: endoribonuclease L-PSP [Oscillatoriales cyanobacterium RU_3_3]|nr:endoribonuclease L-PSP [Oscillatoriales cyanobacterium RU_3_3]